MSRQNGLESATTLVMAYSGYSLGNITTLGPILSKPNWRQVTSGTSPLAGQESNNSKALESSKQTNNN